MNDQETCARIARHHARTFALAACVLPATKRRAAFALYAFCRTADDIVDRAPPNDPGAVTALDDHVRALDRALSGHADTPIFRELVWAVREFGVPAAPLYELAHGVARDLSPSQYATWAETAAYCEGVAGSVGEACTYVFEVPGGEAHLARAITHARALGLAMQLTNILRDVGEDARRGRCYLPDSDLAQFGLSRRDVLSRGGAAAPAPRGIATPRSGAASALGADARWRALMQFEVARARSLYTAAMPGIALLARDAQRCATACAHGYAEILSAIERQRYDTIATRAVVSPWRKASLMLRALTVNSTGPATA